MCEGKVSLNIKEQNITSCGGLTSGISAILTRNYFNIFLSTLNKYLNRFYMFLSLEWVCFSKIITFSRFDYSQSIKGIQSNPIHYSKLTYRFYMILVLFLVCCFLARIFYLKYLLPRPLSVTTISTWSLSARINFDINSNSHDNSSLLNFYKFNDQIFAIIIFILRIWFTIVKVIRILNTKVDILDDFSIIISDFMAYFITILKLCCLFD